MQTASFFVFTTVHGTASWEGRDVWLEGKGESAPPLFCRARWTTYLVAGREGRKKIEPLARAVCSRRRDLLQRKSDAQYEWPNMFSEISSGRFIVCVGC